MPTKNIQKCFVDSYKFNIFVLNKRHINYSIINQYGVLMMKYIIALLICYTISMADETSPHLLKKIVVGGNKNASLGQVIGGYSNGFHVGIRIPSKVALSVGNEENYQLSKFNVSIYPNPTNNGGFNLNAENIKDVQVFDLNGKVVGSYFNFSGETITLPNKGVYIVRITNKENSVQSSTVIFN